MYLDDHTPERIKDAICTAEKIDRIMYHIYRAKEESALPSDEEQAFDTFGRALEILIRNGFFVVAESALHEWNEAKERTVTSTCQGILWPVCRELLRPLQDVCNAYNARPVKTNKTA